MCCTCSNNLTRSMGATAVLEIAAATPPAMKSLANATGSASPDIVVGWWRLRTSLRVPVKNEMQGQFSPKKEVNGTHYLRNPGSRPSRYGGSRQGSMGLISSPSNNDQMHILHSSGLAH